MKSHSANKWTMIAQNSSDSALVRMLASNVFELVYAAQAELARRSSPQSARPNLDKWEKELREGKRTFYDFDDLWRKACDEMNKQEWRMLIVGYIVEDPPPAWDA